MAKGLYRARQSPESGGAGASTGLWQRMELRLPAGGEASPLWPGLEERLDTVPTQPRLRAGLVLKARPHGESPTHVLGDAIQGRYFDLGEREAFIVALLDGQRQVGEVARAYTERFGPPAPAAVERFIQDLRLAGLLEEGGGLWLRLGLLQRSGPTVLWTLPGAEEKVAALDRRLRPLSHPALSGLALLLALGASALLAAQWEVLRADLAFLGVVWWRVPLLLAALYLAMVPVVLTHELAHALACARHGGRVARFGLLLQRLLPAAFADVSDIWSMPRQARVAVFLAGPACTALWAAGATALWALTPSPGGVHLLAGALALATLYSTAVALVPVAGYDGSEMLAEWLQVPDLHRRALSYGWARLRRQPARQPARRPPAEQRTLALYAAAFVLYQVAMIALAVWLFLHLVL